MSIGLLTGIFATRQSAREARNSEPLEGAVKFNEIAASVASHRVLTIGAWLMVLFACLQILMFPFGHDQGSFAVIADKVLAGGMPYRDAWDIKPPAIFYFYALAQYLFGHRMIALRILEVAGLLSLYFPMRTIGAELFSSRMTGLFAWALAVLAYASSDYWHTGQPDGIGAILTIWAMAFAIDPAPRVGRAGAWAAMGLLFGLSFLFKQNLALSAIPCAAYAGWLEWHRTGMIRRALEPAVIGGMASLAPIVACIEWFWMRGAWGAMYETSFGLAAGHLAVTWKSAGGIEAGLMPIALKTLLVFWLRLPALIQIGLAAALVMRPKVSEGKPAALLLGGMIALQLVGVAAQAKFFGYHYTAAVMLCAIAAGAGIAKLWDRCSDAGGPGKLKFALAVVGLGIAIPAMRPDVPSMVGLPAFWRRSAIRTEWLLGIGPIRTRDELDQRLYASYGTSLVDYRHVAEAIDRMTRADDSIFLWGSESVIYWLAERRPASRYVYDVPLRTAWQEDQTRVILMSELKASPPAIVVIEAGDFVPDIVGNALDSQQSLQTFPQLQDFFTTYYKPVTQIGRLFVLRRISSTKKQPG